MNLRPPPRLSDLRNSLDDQASLSHGGYASADSIFAGQPLGVLT